MNLPLFLARRLRHAPTGSFSATVTRVGIVTVALGVAVLLVAFAVLFGFKETIRQKIFVFGAHLQIEKITLNQSYEAPPISLNAPAIRNVAQMPGVARGQGVVQKAGILKTPDELAGAVLKGVGPDYNWALLAETLTAGRLPNLASDTAYSKEILISQHVANQLRLRPGSSVIMYFLGGQPRPRKLEVVGIYETGLEEVDQQLIVGDRRLIQRLNGWTPDLVSTYEVFVDDFTQLPTVARQVFRALPNDLRLLRVDDQYRPLFDWMGMLDRTTSILITLIAVVVGINMISVLLVLLLERTPMIGLMKALGANNQLLRRLFVYVGLNMVVWGLLLGNVLGLGLSWVQWKFRVFPLDYENYYMRYVPIRWDWPTIVLVNVVTIALIAAVLWLPTFIVSRIQPVRALGFKK